MTDNRATKYDALPERDSLIKRCLYWANIADGGCQYQISDVLKHAESRIEYLEGRLAALMDEAERRTIWEINKRGI